MKTLFFLQLFFIYNAILAVDFLQLPRVALESEQGEAAASHALDIAKLKKIDENIFSLAIEYEWDGNRCVIVTGTDTLKHPDKSIPIIHNFVSGIKITGVDQAKKVMVKFRVQAYAAPYCSFKDIQPNTVDVMRKVDVLWPDVTRARFFGESLFNIYISKTGVIVSMELIHASNDLWALNAAGALSLMKFGIKDELTEGQCARVGIRVANDFTDDGDEVCLFELKHVQKQKRG